VGEASPSARYALLVGNIFGGHREKDGSADALVWLIDDQGLWWPRLRGSSPCRWRPCVRRTEAPNFIGERAGYRIDATGLTSFPTRSTPKYAGIGGPVVQVAEGRILASVNVGSGAGGGYRTEILDISDPSMDRTIDRYLDAMSVCSDRTYLLTTGGLTFDEARWEDAATGEVLSTTPDDRVGGINDELLCQDGVIYAFERVPSGLELGSVELSRWDTRDSFARSSIPLVDERGRPLADDGTWDDGGRGPSEQWLMDGQLVWTNDEGEVWGADLDTGRARVLTTFPAMDPRNSSSTRQGETVVKAYQFADEILIRRYSIPDLRVLDEVTVNQTPRPTDMLVSDAVAVDF